MTLERFKTDYDQYALISDGPTPEEDPDVPMDVDDDVLPFLTDDWSIEELDADPELRAACVRIYKEIRLR